MKTKERILLESAAWKEEKLSLDNEYFVRLNAMHHPRILWISSTDSLVSIRDMTNTQPGDIIVYRNIGNQVREDDLSLLAVLEEAIEVLNVSHIIICGYSHCTGIRDVLQGTDDRPFVKEWLKNLRSLYEEHLGELEGKSLEAKEKILSELNIKQQVMNLSRTPNVQKAWERGDYPQIFGWYFDLQSGSLQEVFSLERNHKIKQMTSLKEAVQS